jgi:hypothetical protein
MAFIAPAIPLIAAGISAATAVAGTAVAVNSSEQQAKAQANAADYNAAVAKNNADLAAQNAETTLQQGDIAQQRDYQEGAQRMGAIRAAMGANDVQLNSGSALALQSDQARTTQQNVQATGYNSLVQAVGLRNQAIDYGSQAGMDTAEATNDTTAGNTRALSSIIGGASSVSGKWASFQQQGIGSGLSGGTTPQMGGVY